MINLIQEDAALCNTIERQATYERILQRAKEIGYSCITKCIEDKVINKHDPIWLLAIKLDTSENTITKIIKKLGFHQVVSSAPMRTRHPRFWVSKHVD